MRYLVTNCPFSSYGGLKAEDCLSEAVAAATASSTTASSAATAGAASSAGAWRRINLRGLLLPGFGVTKPVLIPDSFQKLSFSCFFLPGSSHDQKEINHQGKDHRKEQVADILHGPCNLLSP